MERLLLAAVIAFAAGVACQEEPPPERHFDEEEESVAGQGGGMPGPGSGGMDASQSSSGVGASTSSGSTTTTTTTETVCHDSGVEPNDSEATATDLGAIEDCDSQVLDVSGVLDGDDIDWYKYSGSDVFGCLVDPTRVINGDGQLLLCKFADCPGAVVTCTSGTPAVSPGGLDGCCGQSSVQIGVDCDGWSDDATIYLAVDKPSSFSCVSYSINMHY